MHIKLIDTHTLNFICIHQGPGEDKNQEVRLAFKVAFTLG